MATLHEIATRIFPVVSPILPSKMNCYTSFFIPPDGSKEGWEDSDEGDKRREEFLVAASHYYVAVIVVDYGEYGVNANLLQLEIE